MRPRTGNVQRRASEISHDWMKTRDTPAPRPLIKELGRNISEALLDTVHKQSDRSVRTMDSNGQIEIDQGAFVHPGIEN